MSVFKDWLGGAGNTVLWVEYEAYARRVFANSPPDWYADPARYASTLIQAQGVIPTQCLSVDVLAPVISTLQDPDAAHTADEIVSALNDDARADFIDNALDALLHRFGNQIDLFIKLLTPADVLRADDDTASIAFDDLDDLSTAVSNFARKLADKPVTGILMEKHGGGTLTDDEIDAYEPIISAARHYDWCTAMSLPDLRTGTAADLQLDLDVMLLPQCPIDLIAAQANEPRSGGGLTDAYWDGAAISASDGAGRLLFGCIPESAKPETVLAVLRELN